MSSTLSRAIQTLVEAQSSLLAFLSNLEGPLEVCSDAPDWDWDLFCQLPTYIIVGQVTLPIAQPT